MGTLYRHKHNGRLYRIYRRSPRMYLGSWEEAEDVLTGVIHKINSGRWKRSYFVPVAHE